MRIVRRIVESLPGVGTQATEWSWVGMWDGGWEGLKLGLIVGKKLVLRLIVAREALLCCLECGGRPAEGPMHALVQAQHASVQWIGAAVVQPAQASGEVSVS